MVTLPASLPSDCSSPILCYYINATSQLQIARVTDAMRRCFERIVFPGERFMFEALPEAWLTIHTRTHSDAEPLQQILCSDLRVSEVDRDTPISLTDNDSD